MSNYTRQPQGRDFKKDQVKTIISSYDAISYNYLLNAEMAMEVNANSYDGIINGTPKLDESKKSILEHLAQLKEETERNSVPVDGYEPPERSR